MAKFVYNGTGLVAPTLGLTLADGDVFEAPDDFTAVGVTPSKGKVTVSSDADPITPDAPAEPVIDASAPAAETPTDTAAPAASN